MIHDHTVHRSLDSGPWIGIGQLLLFFKDQSGSCLIGPLVVLTPCSVVSSRFTGIFVAKGVNASNFTMFFILVLQC